MMFFFTLLLGAVCTAWASGPVIKASAGTFEGVKLTSKSGQFYNAFRGIPFAEPPVRDLRFRAPVAAAYLDGLYDATDFKPYCIQMNIIPNVFDLGQEDCLYLNVFTPRGADRDDGNLKKISGESAGGYDTSLLNLVPGSRDLFTRTYCQSGTTGVKNSVLITNPRPEAIKLGRRLGCLENDQADPVTDSEFDHMVNCLRLVPAMRFSHNGPSLDIPYLQPVLYGDLFPKDIGELFSDEAYLKSIKFFDRDYLVGLNKNEGGFIPLLNDQILSTLPEEARQTLPPNFFIFNSITTFLTPVFGPVSQEVIEKVAEYYENNNECGPLADFGADALFNFFTLQYVTAAAAGRSAEDSRVYLFRFVHEPQYLPEPHKGIVHGFDLLYLFDIDLETMIKIIPFKADISKWNKDDDLLKHKFMAMVVDFIKTGNPGLSLNSDLPTKWPGFDRIQQQYLKFGLNAEVKNHLLPERIKLWSEQIPKWIEEFPLPK